MNFSVFWRLLRHKPPRNDKRNVIAESTLVFGGKERSLRRINLLHSSKFIQHLYLDYARGFFPPPSRTIYFGMGEPVVSARFHYAFTGRRGQILPIMVHSIHQLITNSS